MQVVNELPEAVEVDVVDGEVFVVLQVVDVVPLNVDRNSGGARLSENLVNQKTQPINFSAEIFDRVRGSIAQLLANLPAALGSIPKIPPTKKVRSRMVDFAHCRF